MRPLQTFLNLADEPGQPLGRRIQLTIRRAIKEGLLPAGSVLPGSRMLAEHFGVHRQTVVAALQHLEAEGLLEVHPNQGTFVAQAVEGAVPPLETEAQRSLGFDVPSALRFGSSIEPEAMLFADGAADPRLAPSDQLARGYRRALARHASQLLEDRETLGTPLLRDMVAAWVGECKGTAVRPEQVLLTRGSRGGLTLLVASLLKAGEAVAVENPGNRGAWELLAQGGRHPLHPVPVDAEGLDTRALEALLARERIRAIYLTPSRQFPTGHSLSPERRRHLMELARRHRIILIEDDYDSAFHYDGPPVRPLLAEDPHGHVVHFSSLSRLLAPGLRLGYVILPAPLVQLLGRVKRVREDQGDPVLEWALGDLIRDGDLTLHLRRVTGIYRARRDHLVAALRDRLGASLEVEPPAGGMGLWLRIRPGVDAQAWVRQARDLGLVLSPPAHFFLGEPESAFRMGFAQGEASELDEAVDRLAEARRRLG